VIYDTLSHLPGLRGPAIPERDERCAEQTVVCSTNESSCPHCQDEQFGQNERFGTVLMLFMVVVTEGGSIP